MFWHTIVLVLAAVAVVPGCTTTSPRPGGAREGSPEPGREFVGTWGTTAGTMSLVLDVRPAGDGMSILIQSGAHGIYGFRWRPDPGGIFIDGVPRFRFWHGRNANEVRVEMEPLAPELTGAEMQRFPLSFFMQRVEAKPRAPVRTAWNVPASWNEATLPAVWDQAAGRRREVVR